jgi:hypothetical protein
MPPAVDQPPDSIDVLVLVGEDEPAARPHAGVPRHSDDLAPTPIALTARVGGQACVNVAAEALLRQRLHKNPNDIEGFTQLADSVRRRAAVGHVGRDRQGSLDAVWALAEELAHDPRAWYPLIELARLSILDDRAAALRRLATAADRDRSGQALVTALDMLRESRMPNAALGLGVAYWRPDAHDLEAGRHLVLAAIEAGRITDARRHLQALSAHPDQGGVATLRAQLDCLIAQLDAEQATREPNTEPAGVAVTRPMVDLPDS